MRNARQRNKIPKVKHTEARNVATRRDASPKSQKRGRSRPASRDRHVPRTTRWIFRSSERPFEKNLRPVGTERADSRLDWRNEPTNHTWHERVERECRIMQNNAGTRFRTLLSLASPASHSAAPDDLRSSHAPSPRTYSHVHLFHSPTRRRSRRRASRAPRAVGQGQRRVRAWTHVCFRRAFRGSVRVRAVRAERRAAAGHGAARGTGAPPRAPRRLRAR
jgi:hypothetical protein